MSVCLKCGVNWSVKGNCACAFTAPAPGENAEAEGYPPIETERTAVSEVGRLRRLYEQTRDQRIRQAKEIDALKAEIERLRRRFTAREMLRLTEECEKLQARAEAAEARVRELERERDIIKRAPEERPNDSHPTAGHRARGAGAAGREGAEPDPAQGREHDFAWRRLHRAASELLGTTDFQVENREHLDPTTRAAAKHLRRVLDGFEAVARMNNEMCLYCCAPPVSTDADGWGRCEKHEREEGDD